MFALLFDRKSLTMTLLALGGMGLLLFVSGFALGSYLNGGLEHLDVIAQDTAPASRPESASRTTAPASRRSIRRAPAPAAAAPDTIEVEEEPALTEPAAEPPAAATDETSSPPADWVPLEEGGSWPGEQETLTGETTHMQATATETAEMEFAEPHSPATPAAPVAPRRAQGFYYVQLGTFSREDLALEKRAEVESRVAAQENEDVAPFLTPVTDRGGRTAYAVRVGPFPTRGAAREAAAGYGRASVVWSSSGRAL